MRLKIIHHNVRSWTDPNNINELSRYYIKEDADIITINSHNIIAPDKHVKLFGYSGYTQNKERHAGVAILVKQHIPHTFHHKTRDKNTLAATITTHHGKISIITFYRPPRQEHLPLLDIQNILQQGNPTIILTDANAKHINFGHKNSDKTGKLLKNLCDTLHLHYLGPDFNTFYSHTNKGKPDIIICNTQFLHLAHLITEGPRITASDHIPITVITSTNPILTRTKETYNYNRANWEKFKEHMENLELPNIQNMNTQDLDEQWEILNNHILEGAKKYIPTKNYRLIPAFTYSNRTRILTNIYNERNKEYRDNMDRNKAEILQRIKNHIDSSKSHDLLTFWSKKIEEIEEYKNRNDPRKLYKTVKNLMGTKNFNKGTYIMKNNREIHDHQEQAETFADTWKDIMTENTPRNTREVQENMNTVLTWLLRNNIQPHNTVDMNRLDKNNTLTKPIKLLETEAFLKKIKSKAVGPTNISTEIIKNTPQKTGIHITRLYNASLSTGHYPKTLKKANIILLTKPNKDLTDPSSYRPISLLDIQAKIFEKIMAHRLKTYLENTQQLNPQQFGFRPGRSIEDIIITALLFLDTHHRQHKKTASISLDIQKAFDKVWHAGLIYKLYNNYNLPDITRKLLSNFIIDRQYSIIHNSKTSTPFFSSAGVPQGSAMSPLIFNLYINDLPQPLRENNTLILQYADDLTILIQTSQKNKLRDFIHEQLRSIDNYQSRWLIETNKAKSGVTLFHQHRSSIQGQPLIRVNGETIPYKDTSKILGIELDNKLTLKKHINTRIGIAKYTLHRLKRFQILDTRIQLQLFRTLSLSQILFSPTTMIFPQKHGIEKLQKLQNKALRQIYCIDWREYRRNKDIHEQHNIPPISDTIYTRFLRAYNRYTDKNFPAHQQILRNQNRQNRFNILLENPPDISI